MEGPACAGPSFFWVLTELQRLEDACRTHKLQVVGRPEIKELAETPLELSKTFEFTVQCEVRPDIELKSVRGVEVRSHSAEVTGL